ncbi:unnamed protein product, partial [Allacma fusca]
DSVPSSTVLRRYYFSRRMPTSCSRTLCKKQ